MFAGVRSLGGCVPFGAAAALTLIAADALAQSQILQLLPQDTTVNINHSTYSTEPTLKTYTWPDYMKANAILLKFDLSALPPGATIQEAVLSLALVESDQTADATYTITAHKLLQNNPVVSAATGYTADGVTPWTANTCCYRGVPLAQADISAPYAAADVDKMPGFKTWTITSMASEWAANPATNLGLVLNSDATKARDRYRYFASTKNADATLRPVLTITYSLPLVDNTPPVISGVSASAISGTGAAISWSTDELADSQVEYGFTAAYGSVTTVNILPATSHQVQVSGLSDGVLYHYRVRSRDIAGNLATSGDFTFQTLDVTAPAVTITAPPAGASVSGTVTVSAQAADNVGVARVQFRLDGANLGAETTSAPYAITWDTLTASAGSHTLSAIATDAAGNSRTSPAIPVIVSNDPPPPPPPPPSSNWPHEPTGFAPWASSALDSFSGNGWNIVNSSGDATIVPDVGGSLTPDHVGRWTYPAGFGGGYAPATMYHALPASFDEGFVGVMWKPGNPWQGHASYVNKIFFLLGGSCGNIYAAMYGPNGGPYHLRIAPEWGNWNWLTPNVNDVPIVLGSWHKIELYFKYNAPGTGVVRWWMDGTAIGDYSNVTFPAGGCFSEFQLSPTWGGVGDVKNETDYYFFDDAYISQPGGSAPPSSSTVLFQEAFDDGNLASRGWYDNTTPLLSTTEHVAGSVSSLQYTFDQGATKPTAGSALRRTFTPTDSVYLGYWVKYSTNWVGSQKPYHPHEFHFLTTSDGTWAGLSFDYLTTYIEQNGGTPLIGIQDGVNIDQSKIGVDLTSVTEHRGVAGCNGSSDGYPDNCYLAGGAYVNEKKWRAAAQYFTDTPGPFYKSDWHFVEAFVKMNSIVGGKGVNDGVVQYWFDGQLIIDHHDVLLRTAANAAMQFDQLVIAPYIGDGSPVTQTLWIDNLTVATGRPQ